MFGDVYTVVYMHTHTLLHTHTTIPTHNYTHTQLYTRTTIHKQNYIHPYLNNTQVEAELRPSWRRLFDMDCAPTNVFQQLRCVVVWEFLCSLGMRPKDVQVAAKMCPVAFTTSLSDGVEPLALLLSQLGIPKVEVRGCMYGCVCFQCSGVHVVVVPCCHCSCHKKRM